MYEYMLGAQLFESFFNVTFKCPKSSKIIYDFYYMYVFLINFRHNMLRL